MKDAWIVNRPLEDHEIDELNQTSITFEIYSPETLSPDDSGWCDWSTGARIISAQDRVIYEPKCQAELIQLQEKFGTDLIKI